MERTNDVMVPATSSSTGLKGWWRRITNGQSFIWWMIGKQRPWWAQVLAVVGFVVLFHGVFQWSLVRTVVMIGSMFLHELGHAYFFVRSQIKIVILYLFPLGAVAAPQNKEEDARSDLLPWNTLGWLLQGGPAVNVGLMVVGVLIQVLVPSSFVQFVGRELVYINGLLAIMNLIPLWTLDAGQLFKLIFSSLEEKHDRQTSWIFTFITVFVVGVFLYGNGQFSLGEVLARLILNFGVIAFLVVFIISVWYKQGQDDPEHAKSSQRMTGRQIVLQLVVYCSMTAIALLLLSEFVTRLLPPA